MVVNLNGVARCAGHVIPIEGDVLSGREARIIRGADQTGRREWSGRDRIYGQCCVPTDAVMTGRDDRRNSARNRPRRDDKVRTTCAASDGDTRGHSCVRAVAREGNDSAAARGGTGQSDCSL
jgi:hypothetical protein